MEILKSQNLEELEHYIFKAFGQIHEETYSRVLVSFVIRLRHVIDENGGYFETILFLQILHQREIDHWQNVRHVSSNVDGTPQYAMHFH